jgi:hypothetical protein
MSVIETSELSAELYEARAFLGTILVRCQRTRSLAVGVAIQSAQAQVNFAIEKLEGTSEFEAVKEVDRKVLNTNKEGVRS